MLAFILHILVILGITAILAVSLNLAIGNTGLLNLAHIAFYGIGAYTSALLTMEAGWPFWVAFLSAGLVAAACSFVVSLVTRNLEGDYLALATLGFAFVVVSLMKNWRSLTHGSRGIRGIIAPNIFGYEISATYMDLIFVGIILAVTIWVVYRITSSRYGKLLGAVRDEPLGLMVLGKNVFQLKWQAMMVSAFFAGIAGSLYAHFIHFIDPTSFFLTDIVLVLTIVLVGGLASLRGALVGSLIIVLLPELLRYVDLPADILGPTRQIFFALILIGILLFKPRGLFGKVDLA